MTPQNRSRGPPKYLQYARMVGVNLARSWASDGNLGIHINFETFQIYWMKELLMEYRAPGIWYDEPRHILYDGSNELKLVYAYHIDVYLVWKLEYSIFALSIAIGGDGDLAVARKLWDLLTT